MSCYYVNVRVRRPAVIIMGYSVIVHEAGEGGYWVEAPALPGCYSQGETLDDALDNVKEAIALYLEALMDDDRRIPMDSDVVFHVAVPVEG